MNFRQSSRNEILLTCQTKYSTVQLSRRYENDRNCLDIKLSSLPRQLKKNRTNFSCKCGTELTLFLKISLVNFYFYFDTIASLLINTEIDDYIVTWLVFIFDLLRIIDQCLEKNVLRLSCILSEIYNYLKNVQTKYLFWEHQTCFKMPPKIHDS